MPENEAFVPGASKAVQRGLSSNNEPMQGLGDEQEQGRHEELGHDRHDPIEESAYRLGLSQGDTMERRFRETWGRAPESIIYALLKRPLWVCRVEGQGREGRGGPLSKLRIGLHAVSANQRSSKGRSRGLARIRRI